MPAVLSKIALEPEDLRAASRCSSRLGILLDGQREPLSLEALLTWMRGD